MPSGDLELLHSSITRELDHLHTIEQRLRNSISGISCTHKQYIGKVIWYIHIMICKASILFRIQNLKKSTGRITAVILGELIHLIQYHNRISGTASLHSFHDPTRHSSYVSSSVPTDFRFIPDSPKTDPNIFAMKSPCNALPDTGLAGTRRSYEQKDRT